MPDCVMSAKNTVVVHGSFPNYHNGNTSRSGQEDLNSIWEAIVAASVTCIAPLKTPGNQRKY